MLTHEQVVKAAEESADEQLRWLQKEAYGNEKAQEYLRDARYALEMAVGEILDEES